MKKTLSSLALLAAMSSSAFAGEPAVKGPFSFEPQTATAATGSEPACASLALPEGFSQKILVEEKGVCPGDHAVLDVVPGNNISADNDWNDMNTVNETGEHVGRFLYTTHENSGGRAALSVLDLKTKKTAVYKASDFGIDPAWSRLDGIEWTPWGTVLVAEENGAFGRLFECYVDGLKVSSCVARPAVGLMSHEGIAAAENGNVYVGDELNGGSIYKFVPKKYGDLSEGTLYALNIPGSTTVCSGTTGVGVTPTGAGEWVALDIAPGQSARSASDKAGVSDFCRPEDAQLIGPNLYFATTTTKNILRITVNTDKPVVSEFVGINTNMNNESDVPEYGLSGPDNLAKDAAGNLIIVEDNSSKSDIWVAPTKDEDKDGAADNVYLFGTLTTPGAEGTGIYFSPTMPKTMFINVQHAADGNDMTIAITKD